jgi:hypothetical protein
MHLTHNYQDELDETINRPSTSIIFGIIGSGKTALGFKLLEIAHKRDPSAEYFLLSYNEGQDDERLHKLIPSWINLVHDQRLDRLPKNSYILKDEAWRFANSKRHAKQAETLALIENLGLIRQRKQHEFVLVQSLATLDIDFFRFGINLLMRFTTPESIATERQDIIDLVLGPYHGFINLMKYQGFDYRELVHITTPFTGLYNTAESTSMGFYHVTLPSFWSQELSHLWSDTHVS